MASYIGQKWSRFFYSSGDFFFKWRVSIQVEIFLIKVEIFQFKSRSILFKLRCFNASPDFFHVEILISSREFFFVLRF